MALQVYGKVSVHLRRSPCIHPLVQLDWVPDADARSSVDPVAQPEHVSTVEELEGTVTLAAWPNWNEPDHFQAVWNLGQ